jgi:hypothetical protein
VSDSTKSGKEEGLLVSVAESIGSTLGSLAAKASAAQKSLGSSTSEVLRKVSPPKRKSSRKKPATRARKGATKASKSKAKRSGTRRATGKKKSSKRGKR